MRTPISLLLLLIVSISVSAQQIADFDANYSVSYNGIQAGELKQSLTTQTDGKRLFTSITQAKGVFAYIKPDVITETSLFQLDGKQIQPLHYSYQRSGGKKNKRLTMDFDWTNMSVAIDDKKHPWTLPIKPGTLDKFVYQIALMGDLNHNNSAFSYTIADGGKLKTYHIGIIDEQEIETPMGYIETIKLTRIKNLDKKRKTTLWCAPELNYLPVKIEHIEKDGTSYSAVLRRLKGIDSLTAFTDPTD